MPALVELYLEDGTLNLDTNSNTLLQGNFGTLQMKPGWGNYTYGHNNLLGSAYGMQFGEYSVNQLPDELMRLDAIRMNNSLVTARGSDNEVVFLGPSHYLCMAPDNGANRKMFFNYCGTGLFTSNDDKYLTVYNDDADHTVAWSLGGLGRAPRVAAMVKLTSVNRTVSTYTSPRGKKVNIMLNNIPGEISDSGEGAVGISGIIAKWSNNGKTVHFYGYDSNNGKVASRINKMGHVPIYIIEFENDY